MGVLAVVFIAVLLRVTKRGSSTAYVCLGRRAMSFGIHVRRLRLLSLLRISLLSALAVAFVRPIGFIGLVAPHIARILLGGRSPFLPSGQRADRRAGVIAGLYCGENSIPGVMVRWGCHLAGRGSVLLSIVLRHRGSLMRVNAPLIWRHSSTPAGYCRSQRSLLPRGKLPFCWGPNGCGKSTLLRSLAGLNNADGEALLDGEDLMSLSFAERARRKLIFCRSHYRRVYICMYWSRLSWYYGHQAAETMRRANLSTGYRLEQLSAHLALRYLDNFPAVSGGCSGSGAIADSSP